MPFWRQTTSGDAEGVDRWFQEGMEQGLERGLEQQKLLIGHLAARKFSDVAAALARPLESRLG